MNKAALCVAAMVVAGLTRPAWAADPFADGRRVDVREGDTWSSATVTGHEGRRYHVRYADGTAADEWVTADRIRPPVDPAGPPLTFAIHDAVDAKWGGMYRRATVVNTRGGWYLIQYGSAADVANREWVESDRVRAVGSTDDPIGYAQPHPYRPGDGPPAGPSTVNGRADQPAAPGRHGRAGPDAPDLTRPDATQGPGGAPLVKPDLSAGHDLDPTTVAAGTPAPDPEPAAPAPHALSLNHGPPQFGTETALLVTPQGRWAALSFRSWSSPTSIQRLELGRNDCGKVVPLAADVQPLAISPDGKRLVTRSDRRFEPASRWRLDLWDVNQPTPKPLFSFRAYDPADDGTDAIAWAAYVDPTHVLTASVNQAVTLWQVDDASAREVYTLNGDGSLRPRLSGGGKYLVAGVGGHVVVVDALTGACVARADDPESPGDGLALRPDLARLALTGGRRLVVLDLAHATGDRAVVCDVGLPPELTGSEVGWVGPDLLLIDDQSLYDVARHRFAWQYDHAQGAGESGGGQTVARTVGNRIWLLMQSGNRITGTEGRSVLSSAVVPDPKVLTADKRMADAGLAVKAPAAVSLSVELSTATDADRQRIVQRYTDQLTAAGFTVSDGQPLRVTVRTSAGKTTEKRYRQFGGFGTNGQEPAEQTLSATETVSELAWERDGKPLWSVSSTSGGVLPGFIFRKEGKSYADTVADLNKPDSGWFLQQHVPAQLLNVSEPAGTSPLSGASTRVRNGR